MPMFRIGQGYDIHKTLTGRKMLLGGVHVSTCPFGLDGHSDADVLLHAITDAYLGALALGDIGEWFPDNDPATLGADSAVLLKQVLAHPQVRPWHLLNLDCTIFAERPKLTPWKPLIRQSIAAIIGCDVAQISVKAKTNERQDAIGEGLAIAASATILLEKNETP